MRRIRTAATVLGLALALASCSAAAPDSASPDPSEAVWPTALPSAAPSKPPASPAQPSFTPSLAASADSDAADAVRDAVIASLAEQTVRLGADVRSSDAADAMPRVTATGQVSFGDPSQFRIASPGVAGTVPAYEVIYDGEHAFSRGRDTPYLPEDTWVTFDVKPGTLGYDALLRQYGDFSLVLVTPLAVTSAGPAGDEMIGNRPARRYVTQVDIAAARPYVPESLLAAYESHMNNFSAAGVPLTQEVEVWVDADGRIARTRYEQELQGQDIDALVVTYDFEDYGAPMEAVPPPGDEVLTVDEARERYEDSLASPNPT
jgi:hypothetical protein